MPTTVVRFSRSLRLGDHAALAHAAGRGAVVPVFVWAPDEEAPWEPGGAHRWWLGESLRALDADLRARGLRLVVRCGPTADALLDVARVTGADRVVWQQAAAPHLAAADRRTEAALREAGLDVATFAGRLLHDPDEIRTGSGGPYRVFGPFWRKVRADVCVGRPLPEPRMGASNVPETWPDSLSVDSLGLSATAQDGVDWAQAMAAEWTPGEAGAHARLERFLDDALPAYPDDRNRPDLHGSSMLSPHLHWGEISPRSVWTATEARVANGSTREGASVFLSEIGWREFSYHVLHHFPETAEQPMKPAFDAFPWRDDADGARAWRRGETGFPIVDAGMRQLWAWGWMHNRVRMITASFLTKDLLIPWPDGARHFWDTLCCGDLASNSMGWQWSAGSGADAQPFFRVFNPAGQGERFDPAGEYVRRWVPELAGLPAKWIHRPHEAPAAVLRDAGVRVGDTYPAPIVDHAAARQRALDALRQTVG